MHAHTAAPRSDIVARYSCKMLLPSWLKSVLPIYLPYAFALGG